MFFMTLKCVVSSGNKLTHQAHMKCIVDQYDQKGRRFDSADDAPDTSYYQWVVFVFAFQVSFAYNSLLYNL